MRPARGAVMVVVLALAACRGTPQSHDDDHRERPTELESRAAEASDDLLRIDPEMLRDLRITTSAVESRPGGDGVTALGEVGVNEERYAEVGSPVGGRVTELHAGAGDAVTAGQPLGSIESVELGKARAESLAARARAELARQTLGRKRGLAAERIVPRREVQEAEAVAAAAAADLRAAQSSLRALGGGHERDDASDAALLRLRSPIAGVVLERDVARGQMIEPSRVLFRVADLSHLWLTVHAFERDAVRVSPGIQARVALAALPGRSFTGPVILVGRRVDPTSRTVPVRIGLANGDGVLRPGMSANAWLPLGEGGATVVTVPAAALQRLHDGWVVFIPHGEGTFEPRQVGRGRDLGGEVEILEGVAPGETVVVEGAFLLKAEGEKARGEGERHEH